MWLAGQRYVPAHCSAMQSRLPQFRDSGVPVEEASGRYEVIGFEKLSEAFQCSTYATQKFIREIWGRTDRHYPRQASLECSVDRG